MTTTRHPNPDPRALPTDRRTENRASRRRPIEVWVQQVLGDRVVLHPAANLSLGGLFLYTNRMRLGDVHRLELTLPGAEAPVQVQARVAWLRGDDVVTGAGMEFVDLPAIAESAIATSLLHD